MLQNLLYQETRRKSFSNTDCIHKPAMLETPPQRWSGRGWLREHCPHSCPVAEDSGWRGTRLFKSWLSPPLQPHLFPQILPPRQDDGISSPQMRCGFLFLWPCVSGGLHASCSFFLLFWFILMLCDSFHIFSTGEIILWGLSHRVLSSLYVPIITLHFLLTSVLHQYIAICQYLYIYICICI